MTDPGGLKKASLGGRGGGVMLDLTSELLVLLSVTGFIPLVEIN